VDPPASPLGHASTLTPSHPHIPVKHQDELREAVKGVQEVSVFEHAHPFGDCPQCVAGYSRCAALGGGVGLLVPGSSWWFVCRQPQVEGSCSTRD